MAIPYQCSLISLAFFFKSFTPCSFLVSVAVLLLILSLHVTSFILLSIPISVASRICSSSLVTVQHHRLTSLLLLRYRNGVLLNAGIVSRYEILASGRQLRIYNAAVKDKGRYTCAANNKAGEDEVDFDLDVLGRLLKFLNTILINQSVLLQSDW